MWSNLRKLNFRTIMLTYVDLMVVKKLHILSYNFPPGNLSKCEVLKALAMFEKVEERDRTRHICTVIPFIVVPVAKQRFNEGHLIIVLDTFSLHRG